MTGEERSELRAVLKALHRIATEKPRDDEELEQRGNAFGTPSWHAAVDLWERALAIADANDADPSFETAWRALVNRARAVLTARRHAEE